MAGSKKLEVVIVGDAKKLSRTFAEASSSAGKFGDKMMKVGKVAAIGLAGGIAVAGIAIKKSVDAALEAEKAQTRLDTAFKAANVTARQRAEAMQEVSKVSVRAGLDDEDLMDTLGRLTRVTGSAAEAQRDMAIAADLARARNLSLEAATKIVEKAELGNIGALKRIGIEIPKVTAAQDALRESHTKVSAEQLKAAKVADDVATRQSAIAALQTQYAGAAEAYGKTAAGAQDRFKVAVENLQETLGAKLLPMLTRAVEWVSANMPTFERVATQAMQKIGAVVHALEPVFGALVAAIRRLVEFARVAWPQVQDAAEKVVAWYRGTLQPAVENVIRALTAIWNRFGGDITRIATTAFNTARAVIQNALNIIRGVVEGVLALIRGDWTQAWNSLKLVVRSALAGVGAIIRGFAKIAFQAAVAIGSALIDGIISGVSSLGDRLRDAVTSKIQGAISGIKGAFSIRSPSGVTAKEIGVPLGEGVIEGWVRGSAALPAKMSESMRTAIEAARQAVEKSRGTLTTAWSAAASDALSAFDAIQGQILTKSEKLLANLRAQRDKEARAGAVTDARAALAKALGGNEEGVVDPASVTAAQKQLDDALWAQREFGLQQRAEQERRELNAKTAIRRRDLEQALAALGEKMGKEGAKAAAASEAVIKLLGRYGVNFKAAGAAMGHAWIEGLRETIGDAARGAGALSGTIARTAGGINVPGRAAGGPVGAGKTYMVGERGPELFTARRRGTIIPNGGGGMVVNVSVNGWVGDDRALAQKIRQELENLQRNGARLFA